MALSSWIPRLAPERACLSPFRFADRAKRRLAQRKSLCNNPMKILLADDHNVLRKGLRRILEEHPDLEVVGEASDGRQAVTLAQSRKPDVVVMDIAMPMMNGLEATRQILQRGAELNVLILSMYSDENYV